MTVTDDAERLDRRLERLSVEAEVCSVDEYQAMADQLHADPGFQQTLARAKAVANENRLTALGLLAGNESLCACEIQAALGLTHATVSHHMEKLASAGLVEVEKRGKWKHYTLAADAGDPLSGVLR